MNHLAILKSGVVALMGVGFFFAIIGVFGLSTSIASLIVFILLALCIFYRQNWNHAPFAYSNPEGTYFLGPAPRVMEVAGDGRAVYRNGSIETPINMWFSGLRKKLRPALGKASRI